MTREPQPLPIWFFVGLILLAYGLIVLATGVLYPRPATVLAHLRPALWWGALMIVAGCVFVGIGLHVHKLERARDGGGPLPSPRQP